MALEDIIKNQNKKEPEAEKEQMVPMSIVNSLMQEIDALKAGQEELKKNQAQGNQPAPALPASKKIARLREYEGKLVVGYDKKRGTWKKYDSDRREDRVMMSIIVLNDRKEEKAVTVDYLRFMEDSVVVEVPVLKITKEEIIQEKGKVSVKEVVDYNTVDTGKKVVQTVVSSKDTYTVLMPDGSEREMDVDFLNI